MNFLRQLTPMLAVLLAGLLGCTRDQETPAAALLPPAPGLGTAAPQINGTVGTPNGPLRPQISYATPSTIATGTSVPSSAGTGDITLDFADIDIRTVVEQILGGILKVNYTIDPAVHGTATLHTVSPVARAQLLSILQALLNQDGATLVRSGALFRVVPAAATGAGSLGDSDTAGSTVVPLRYASADDLARVLQPFAGAGARIIAAPGANALLISADSGIRDTLVSLVRAFDTDLLAGSSYALLPAPEGSARDFATALQDAFRTQGGGGLAGVLRVVPMDRVNAVLVVATQPRYIDDARRVYALVQRARRNTVRSWHVYYLQNSHAQDAAYLLQQAFTPDAVTATPSSAGQTAPGRAPQQTGAGAASPIGTSGLATSGLAASGISASGLGTSGIAASGLGMVGTGASASTVPAAPPVQTQSNPLLGGLDQSAVRNDTDTMRIIPDPQNNAVLVYATQQEEDTVEAMLRKTDILPLQVRIDATIAEVTLNDQLQYGTQFFFKAGGINGILNNATAPLGNPAATVLGTAFPGFVLGGKGQGGAPIALQALQAVTTVHILSSPELLVLDNQPARLQVGDFVPYLTSISQSTLTSGAPIVNSVNYQPTGVIMNVTPRVNSGGLVTLDISQEVSGIDSSVTTDTTGIASPTFSERSITSRVVIQDGQTVGLAGLITDQVTRGNSGIPFLKDIPLLGVLAGTQNNQRTRTELLVLITPHVLHDAHDAQALTQDLEDQLSSAAGVRTELQSLRPSGSVDPSRPLRRAFQPGQ